MLALANELTDPANYLVAGQQLVAQSKKSQPQTVAQYVAAFKGILNDRVLDFMSVHQDRLDQLLAETAPFENQYDWFAAYTLLNLYSTRVKVELDSMESPNFIWLRIAVQLYWNQGIEYVTEAYHAYASGKMTPPSPTLFNAGSKRPQMSSCFLLKMDDDITDIMEKEHAIGEISVRGGGIGVDVSRLRHSEIANVGKASGLCPLIEVLNYKLRYYNQGGRRKGAGAVYIQAHHLDLKDVLTLVNKNSPKCAADIYICIYVTYFFLHRIATNSNWTLFCPAKVPHLETLCGADYAKAYIEAEQDPRLAPYRKTVSARELYDQIMTTQFVSGHPYIMNKDAVNWKSNHQHLGYISSSNLCTEITQYTDKENISSCNLHAISVRAFAKGPVDNNKIPSIALKEAYDFETLGKTTRQCVTNINQMIEHNFYPLDKGDQKGIIHTTNLRQRPIAIGVSGFAEMLYLLDIHYEHPLTVLLNKMVFACIYFNALAESVRLAQRDGPCEIHHGSSMAEGRLQFDLWNEEYHRLSSIKDVVGDFVKLREVIEPIDPVVWGQQPLDLDGDVIQPTWADLKRAIKKYGVRNSLHTAIQPTASTAHIRGNSENVEPPAANLYSRTVLIGNFTVGNILAFEDYRKIGAWNNNTIQYLLCSKGSFRGFRKYLQENLDQYPEFTGDVERLTYLELKYKTIYEIPQRKLIDLAADRGPYLDQAHSFSLHLNSSDPVKLRAAHFYAASKGLKTIQYYLRTLSDSESGGKITANAGMTSNPLMLQCYKSSKSVEATEHNCCT